MKRGAPLVKQPVVVRRGDQVRRFEIQIPRAVVVERERRRRELVVRLRAADGVQGMPLKKGHAHRDYVRELTDALSAYQGRPESILDRVLPPPGTQRAAEVRVTVAPDGTPHVAPRPRRPPSR